MSPVNVLVLDQNIIFYRAAREFMLTRQEVGRVDHAGNPSEIGQATGGKKIDLVLVDDRLCAGGSNTLVQLKEKLPQAVIVLMALYKSDLPDEGSEQTCGRISKQEFASEMTALLNTLVSNSG